MINKLKNITSKPMAEENVEYILLENVKGEVVVQLKRFDNNTWILENGKTTDIVKVKLVDRTDEYTEV